MTYKKVGGIRFVRIGRVGFNFYWSRKRAERHQRRLLPAVDPVKIIDDGIRVIVSNLAR